MKTIKNIQNLSLSDFLFEVNNSDLNTFVCDIDLYLHLKKLTDNFENELLERVMYDIYNYWLDYILYLFEEQEMSLTSIKEYYRENYTGKLLNIVLEKWQHLGELIVEQGISKCFIDSCFPYFLEELETTEDLDKLIEEVSEEKETYSWDIESFDMQRLHKNGLHIVFKYFNMAIKKYIEITSVERFKYWADSFNNYESGRIGGLKNPNRPSKKIINFDELFKFEYKDRIEVFKCWLKKERYLNESNEIAIDYTQFARIFFYLQEICVCHNKPMIQRMTVYFKEFNVDVVEERDNTSNTIQVTRTAVTNFNAQNTTLIDEFEKKSLLKLFVKH
jgi:hypothetical protein